MIKLTKKPAGFTLLELIIATAIFTFFLIVIVAGLLNVTKVFQKTSGIVSNQQAARIILEDIQKEAEFSQKVELITNLTTIDSSPTQTSGICITRSRYGKLLFYIEQLSDESGLWATKRMHKTNSCDKNDINKESGETSSDGLLIIDNQTIGSNSVDFDNINVQNFALKEMINDNGPTDYGGGNKIASYEIILSVRTRGEPTTSTEKQFDDEVTLTSVIFPSQLDYLN